MDSLWRLTNSPDPTDNDTMAGNNSRESALSQSSESIVVHSGVHACTAKLPGVEGKVLLPVVVQEMYQSSFNCDY